MDDKSVMEEMLLLQKGVCDLFLHGTVEASGTAVRRAFQSALNDALTAQDTICTKMAEKGWYPAETADAARITSVKQKFSSGTN